MELKIVYVAVSLLLKYELSSRQVFSCVHVEERSQFGVYDLYLIFDGDEYYARVSLLTKSAVDRLPS